MSIVETRQKEIIQRIEEKGPLNVSELADLLNVSEMTIRRDFRDLENKGIIKRFFGGAVISRGRSFEPPLITRKNENSQEKEIIGKFAAGMVMEGDSLALDVGSTVFQVAKNLIKISNITLLTPSLLIAELFYDNPDVKLILPGGVVRPSEHSLIGEFTRRTIEQFYFDRLFLGAAGIHSVNGITEYNFDDALIKQALIKNSKEVILVVDSTKFQKTAFSYVTNISEINHLVTNLLPPNVLCKELRKANVLLHVVN